MKYDFIIFGGTGMQGGICARDVLESGYSTLLVGRNSEGITDLLKKHKESGFIKVDLNNQKDIVKAINKSGAKIVINCAELTFNIAIMNACLACKKSCTDLGGLQEITEQQFKLDNKFKKSDILCITGCGSTPGILNVITAHALEDYDSIETINLGFAWNSNIKRFVLPYSIQSIFEEFTQPPMTYHNGKFIKESRVRCLQNMNFKEVGKQTTYCIVHSEVYTFVRYFKKKGLRNIHYLAGFPEHSKKTIQTLIDLGFSSAKSIKINNIKIRPVDFTNRILKNLSFPEGYKEVEDLWVRIYGKKNNKKKHTKIDCIIRTAKGWESAGSNIDTGRTISIISQMLFKEKIKEKGVHAPEGVVPHKEFISELGKREMKVYIDGRKIN